MARPLRIQYPGAYYHITSRGIERRSIFHNNGERLKFLAYLESATERYNAVIHAYCLMNNHYHLLLETPAGNLSQIMRHINGAYTSYFNTKRRRAGHLFQGRFKGIVIDADDYAKELSRYIHLNPVRTGIVEKPEQYRWSSYAAYIGKVKVPSWLNRDFILGYMGGKTSTSLKRYHLFVDDHVGRKQKSPLEAVYASTILGGDDFIKAIKLQHVQGRQADRDIPAIRELIDKPGIETIIQQVNAVFENDRKMAKRVALYLAHRYSGERLREIGNRFDMSESGVSQASRRFSIQIKKDKRLNGQVKKIGQQLNLSNV